MAYQTGSVNSLADIQNVIQTFLTGDGWTWDAGSSTIYKDTIFVEMRVSGNRIWFRAATSLGVGLSPYVAIGQLQSLTGWATFSFTFPATYYAFLNGDEFYFIVNYDVTRYQFVTFGKSTIDFSDSGGVGTFLSATGTATILNLPWDPIATNANGAQSSSGGGAVVAAAPFFSNSPGNDSRVPSDFVHSNILGQGWALWNGSFSVGNSYQGNILGVLPNTWNGESPLLPIRAYKYGSESKISLVLDLQHARHCRVDNFNEAEIISIGSDQWQVFPHHRKNIAARNGGIYIDHTGTLGWAIRKVD